MNWNYTTYPENHKEKLELYRLAKLFVNNFIIKMTDPLYVKTKGWNLKKYRYRNIYSYNDEMNLPSTVCYRIERAGVTERFHHLDIEFIPQKIDRPYLNSEERDVYNIRKGINTYNIAISYRGRDFIPDLIMKLYKKKFNIKGFTSAILSQNNDKPFTQYSNNHSIVLLDFRIYTKSDFLDFENTKELMKNWLTVIAPIEYRSQLYHYISDRTYKNLECQDEFSIKERNFYEKNSTVSINECFQLAQVTTLGQVLNAILTG